MLFDQDILTFSEAAKAIPRVNGRRVHASTMWRWATKGVNGVHLETRRMGRRYVTTKSAIDTFCRKVAEVARERPDPPPVRTDPASTRRDRETNQALGELQAAGWA